MKKLVEPCPLIEYVLLLSKKIYDTFNENVLFIFPSARKSELTDFAVAEPESFYSVRIWEKSEELPLICKSFKPLFAFSDIEGACDDSTRIFTKKKKDSFNKEEIQYYIFGVDNSSGEPFKEYEKLSYNFPEEEPVFSRAEAVISQKGIVHEKVVLDRFSSGKVKQIFDLRERLDKETASLKSKNTKAYLRIEFNGSVLRTLVQIREYNPKGPYFDKFEKLSKKFSDVVYQVFQ